jgi:sugar O-acyltransferase (sialic acid O-acetyltransferase NeuD family)
MSFIPAAEAVYIIGAGGHGRELNSYVRDLVRAGWQGRVCGFLDDGLAPGAHGGVTVVGHVDALRDADLEDSPGYITAFGDNRLRRKMVARVESIYGGQMLPWTLIHPSAIVGCGSEIGEGTCLAPGSIVTAKTKIGRHAILNVKASVSHDCAVGDFANINPGATICGWVSIGEGAYVGAGAVVKDRINVGPWSVIGAGAVVVRDVPAHATVVGVPARIIRQGREEQERGK